MTETLTYPFCTMRITQTYHGRVSHLGHSRGTPRDYPIDEGGADGGRDPLFAPCSLQILRIWGMGTQGVNTLFCQSTAPVQLANGETDVVSFQITHPNDSDLRQLRVGQTFEQGARLCREGADGAGGNHIHLSVGRGALRGNGWQQNSRGKWVLTAAGGPLKPEEAFFVDPTFTTVLETGGLRFRPLPPQSGSGVFRVTASLLRVRTGPGRQYPQKPFAALSQNARSQILALSGEKRGGYVRGMLFTALEIRGGWARTASGWVCLSYCEAAA